MMMMTRSWLAVAVWMVSSCGGAEGSHLRHRSLLTTCATGEAKLVVTVVPDAGSESFISGLLNRTSSSSTVRLFDESYNTAMAYETCTVLHAYCFELTILNSNPGVAQGSYSLALDAFVFMSGRIDGSSTVIPFGHTSLCTSSSSSSSSSSTGTSTSTSVSCPVSATSSPTTFTTSGAVNIAVPISATLCTLVRVTSTGFLQPVGRSYNGQSWETTAGAFSALSFSCQSNSLCTINLPALDANARYELTTLDPPVYSDADQAARFLEQATFGPTQTEVDALVSSNSNLLLGMATWVQSQIASLSVTSHRARYRELLNARFQTPTHFLGAVTQPCQTGARYRRFAFSGKDYLHPLTVSTDADLNKRVMSVDGFVRTVVSTIQYEVSFDEMTEQAVLGDVPDGSYTICNIQSRINGRVGIVISGSEECTSIIIIGSGGNPTVEFFGSITPNIVVDIPSNQATPIDGIYFRGRVDQEIILTSDLMDTDCTTTIGTTGNPINPVFAVYNGVNWIHDPRFDIFDNTVAQPAPDGGGRVVQATENFYTHTHSAICANTRRNFLNGDGCFLSSDPNTCAAGNGQDESLPAFFITMNPQTIRTLYTATANDVSGQRYFYIIDGLRIEDDPSVGRPCTPFAFSRWLKQTCSGLPSTVGNLTASFLTEVIARTKRNELNPYMVDVSGHGDPTCDAADVGKVGFEIVDPDGVCWRNVHPDLMNVYDFTFWTQNHDGNKPTRNPITEPAEAGNTTLVFPSWHEMSRWQNRKQFFGAPIRLGDEFDFFSLDEAVRTASVIQAFGVDVSGTSAQNEFGANRLVCGSPNEIANNPSLGGSASRGAFDGLTLHDVTSSVKALDNQKTTIWTNIILGSDDQLRQRIAWALSQILVVSETAIIDGQLLTEIFVAYYDIFVRNAFGSYRDVLKEVSYSPIMAEMLTYKGSRSTAYVWTTSGTLEFADENYAREVMQLFTLGLFQLTLDGNEIPGPDNEPLRVYSNDDIEEYARVWTGFESQYERGNMEEGILSFNRIDPMRIVEDFRDLFPKMGLNRNYVGDGYPLCADLPNQHFLKKGATYHLLGSTSLPDLQNAPAVWDSDPAAVHLTLQPNGAQSLFAKLCGSTVATSCQFSSKVVLDQDLVCSGTECNVDTVRTIQVANNIFYEYIRPPCVQQAFFQNPKTVMTRNEPFDTICADPRTESASVACCDSNGPSWKDVYYGERTTFQTAQTRCSSQLCMVENGPDCGQDPLPCEGDNRYWTNTACSLRAKIDNNGRVGIVHLPGVPEEGEASKLVAEDTKTFFRVDWTGDYTPLISNCTATTGCSATTDGMCMCDVTVTEAHVYSDGTTPSVDDILSNLRIGAFDPAILSSTTFSQSTTNGVTAYTVGGTFAADTIFQVTDAFGVVHFRKNIQSTVRVTDSVSFRNPVHFMSLADPEERDAHYETDAALDHYFYHQNTAPFLSTRFAQRFGISNPSPQYIKAIATAFQTGTYSFVPGAGNTAVEFGDRKYGNLASTIACILLHDEARSVILDADPSHGSLKEPLIKVVGLMRSMEFQLKPRVPFVTFGADVGQSLGEMAHKLPNVFSFFLPEFSPSGAVMQANLVAPEAQVLTGPRIVGTLNGLMSIVKYGFSPCFGGFSGPYLRLFQFDCSASAAGQYDESVGNLAFAPTITTEQAVVSQLATLLTSGRLSAQSRTALENVYRTEPNPALKLIRIQQLLVTAPEFHVTNLVRRTGQLRPVSSPPAPSTKPYKAVVYILLEGGVDSFNMLVPHTCESTSVASGMTLLQQYNTERTTLAMTDAERTRIINAAGQPCSQFAIHPELAIVESLYNQNDLAFFANAGVINKPVNKDNYIEMTRTELFAHNTMQAEAQRVDPFRTAPGTGILGRVCDALLKKGYNPQPITIDDNSVATVGVPGQGVSPLLMSQHGATSFNPSPNGETFDATPHVRELNGDTQTQSSVFGETWSAGLGEALTDNELILQILQNTQLTQTFADTDFSQQLKTVATLINSHNQRGTDRDVFFVTLSSWDHHFQLKTNLAANFVALNQAFTTFVDEMKALGLWNQVTVAITSDFARTLTANSGEGSDHAWGGNYFIMGGDVKGGVIHGQYPEDITHQGSLNIGRGRLLPTLSWESILTSIASWLGLETEAELDYAMPNRGNTNTKLFTKGEVFN